MENERLKDLLRAGMEEAVRVRRDLHRHPETAFEEVRTSALIRETLTAMGVEQLDGLIPTAVIGRIRGERPGPTVLLREDIDGLPMRELTGLPFASENSACHSCGHDIHTGSLLLLAGALQRMREEIPGTVLLLFQPAEETASGAKALFSKGFGTGETAYDQVLGFHTAPDLPVGEIGICPGPANASTDIIRIVVRGAGGHGAYPERCGDTVAAAAYLITQLQTIISRERPALQPAVLTFGSIHGGTAPNIMPTDVVFAGTLRSFSEEGRHRMWDSIRRITEHGAAALRVEGEAVVDEGVPVLANDPAVCAAAREAADRILGPGHVHGAPPLPGSDDFSCFLACAPGLQFRVGTSDGTPEGGLGIHNPRTTYAEEAMYVGAAVMGEYILGLSAET